MFKLNKSVVVHGSFSSFSAIWSHNLSGLQAWICVLLAPVPCLSSLLPGGSPQRRDLLAISVPFPASQSPNKLLLHPSSLGTSASPRSPSAMKIFLPLPLWYEAGRARACEPAFSWHHRWHLPIWRAKRPPEPGATFKLHLQYNTLHLKGTT